MSAPTNEPAIKTDGLDQLLADHQLFHSNLQMDSFITIKSGGTAYGCYKQALRELYKRVRGLKDLYARRELLKIDIEERQLAMGSVGEKHDAIAADFARRRLAIQLQIDNGNMTELEFTIKHTEREFTRFYEQAVFLKGQVGELDDATRDKLEEEMWHRNLYIGGFIEMLATGTASENTMRLIMAYHGKCDFNPLSDGLHADELNHTQRYAMRQLEEFIKETPELPSNLNAPAIENIQRLIGEVE